MNLAWYLGEICRSVQTKGSMFKFFFKFLVYTDFADSPVGKESAGNIEDPGSIPELG